MPFVHVHWFEGRTDEQKAEIAKRIEEALVEVAGAAPEHCWVKFSDSSKSDFIIGEPVRVGPATTQGAHLPRKAHGGSPASGAIQIDTEITTVDLGGGALGGVVGDRGGQNLTGHVVLVLAGGGDQLLDRRRGQARSGR